MSNPSETGPSETGPSETGSDDPLLFAPAVARLIGMKPDGFRKTVDQLIADEGFPRPITAATGKRARAHPRWWRSGVMDWKRRKSGAAAPTPAENFSNQAERAIARLRAS